jgi:hypothetical protein
MAAVQSNDPEDGYPAARLLHLSDDALDAVLHLRTAYPAEVAHPLHLQVNALLDTLLHAVPLAQLTLLASRRPELRVVGPQARYHLHTPTLKRIRRALKQRQYLAFDYTPTLRSGVESHRVAPVELMSRDSHTYLAAYCEALPRPMEECCDGYVEFRVDQIVPETVQKMHQLYDG